MGTRQDPSLILIFDPTTSTMCSKTYHKAEGSQHERKRRSISRKMCQKYHELWSRAHRYSFHAPQLRSLNTVSRFSFHAFLSLIATNCRWIVASTRVLIADHNWRSLAANVSRSTQRPDDAVQVTHTHIHARAFVGIPRSQRSAILISYHNRKPTSLHSVRPLRANVRAACCLKAEADRLRFNKQCHRLRGSGTQIGLFVGIQILVLFLWYVEQMLLCCLFLCALMFLL